MMHVLVQPVHPVLVLQVRGHSTVEPGLPASLETRPAVPVTPAVGWQPRPGVSRSLPEVSRSGCWPGSESSCSRR